MNFLVVDDEPGALEELSIAISNAEPRADLFAFDKPSEALACAQSERMDVAFLDIDMGGMSGLSLAKKLKEIHDGTNIVFVTVHTNYAVDAFSMYASGYILKPASTQDIKAALENLRQPLPPKDATGLSIRTFGNFEVLYNGMPLHFARSKAKELLAYLVHKRGTGCSVREIASVLYEDRPYMLSVQRQTQTVIHTLIKTLKEIGCEDILSRTYNNISVRPDRIHCDLYHFLNGNADDSIQYTGEYMANYSWAEGMSEYLFKRETLPEK